MLIFLQNSPHAAAISEWEVWKPALEIIGLLTVLVLNELKKLQASKMRQVLTPENESKPAQLQNSVIEVLVEDLERVHKKIENLIPKIENETDYGELKAKYDRVQELNTNKLLDADKLTKQLQAEHDKQLKGVEFERDKNGMEANFFKAKCKKLLEEPNWHNRTLPPEEEQEPD